MKKVKGKGKEKGDLQTGKGNTEQKEKDQKKRYLGRDVGR